MKKTVVLKTFSKVIYNIKLKKLTITSKHLIKIIVY